MRLAENDHKITMRNICKIRAKIDLMDERMNNFNKGMRVLIAIKRKF